LTSLETALRRLALDLDALGRSWALVGGLAVSARTEPRFTRDVDVAVAVADDAAAEDLIRALRDRGYRPGMMLEQEAKHRLAMVRLEPPETAQVGIRASPGAQGPRPR